MTKFLSDSWLIDNGFVEPDIQSGEWWSDHVVENLGLSQPVTVSTTSFPGLTSKLPITSTVAEAIETLKMKGFDQVPVVTAEGSCKGTVTIGNLTSLLVSGRVKCEDTVDKALYKQFKKVRKTDSSR